MTESYEAYETLRDQATGEAGLDHDECVGDVLAAISKGAAEKAWSMRYDKDDYLLWGHERQVWAGEDGYAYDDARFFAYSRSSGI